MRKERPKGELTGGSLFSGIGGLDLGFERAGIKVLWQIENNPFCQQVLAQRFPHAIRRRDARKTHDLPPVDVLFGGFPCQLVSNAGRRLFTDDPRWLWPIFHRWIEQYRPKWVVIENVEGLRTKGLQEVLEGLADSGYDAEWDRIPAAAVGAPHLRKRYFIVGYPQGVRQDENSIIFRPEPSDSSGVRRNGKSSVKGQAATERGGTEKSSSVASYSGSARYGQIARGAHGDEDSDEGRASQNDHVADSHGQGIDARVVSRTDKQLDPPAYRRLQELGSRRKLRAVAPEASVSGFGWWGIEPDVGRVAYGIPARVDRLTALGNAVVPQVAEWVARRIVDAENAA